MFDLSWIPPTSATGKLLRAPLRLVPPGMRVRVLQGPLRGCRWIAGSASHGCWLGTYEKAKQQLVARLLRPGDVVFDVGANVGLYTLLASLRVGPEGRVVAFEPLPGNLDYLAQHLELNRVKNVEVVGAAVGRARGHSSFVAAGSRSMGRLGSGGSLEVDVVCLDDLVASGRVPPPDLIKMDIEGGEVEALVGAQTVLREHRPTVVLATHGWEKHQECLRLLRGFRYEVEALSGGDVEATDELIARPG
jgi:FkbM family methyltransferase